MDLVYFADHDAQRCEAVEFVLLESIPYDYLGRVIHRIFLQPQVNSERFQSDRVYIAFASENPDGEPPTATGDFYSSHIVLVKSGLEDSSRTMTTGGVDVADRVLEGGFFFAARESAERECQEPSK